MGLFPQHVGQLTRDAVDVSGNLSRDWAGRLIGFAPTPPTRGCPHHPGMMGATACTPAEQTGTRIPDTIRTVKTSHRASRRAWNRIERCTGVEPAFGVQAPIVAPGGRSGLSARSRAGRKSGGRGETVSVLALLTAELPPKGGRDSNPRPLRYKWKYPMPAHRPHSM